ncbi:MAG: GLPGLI family protein [Winogradskyella sp.]|nr:GLPGLI family protein [Winogradskyella sp.]
MITIIRVLVLGLILVVSSAHAQDFQGVATYRTQQKIDIKMDSTSVGFSKENHAMMMEMMKKQFQKTFNLSFNKEASVYKEEESLDQPQLGGGGMQIKIVGAGGGSDVLYKNTKDSRYSDQKDTMGKIFLVKDEIKPIQWKLQAESKFIGEYQCYKATYTKQVEVFKAMSFHSDSKVKKEGEKEGEVQEDQEREMEDRIITAWYTPQIPINNGPAMYQGLPGLILEVHDGKLTIICSKIVINPEEKIEIKEPEKGKEVNQKEYTEIMDKKSKEMMERYAPKKGREGDGYHITIGG